MAPTPSTQELLRHLGWIRRLAGELAGEAADADDLAQDVALTALRSPPPPDRAWRGWLSGIARNKALQSVRRTGLRRARELDEHASAKLPAPPELLARAETQREVVEALMALAPAHRDLLLLRWFEGLGPREIARASGVPSSTVRTRLQRAHGALRRELDARHGGDRSAWSVGLAALAAPVGAKAPVGALAVAAVVAALLALTWWVGSGSSDGGGPLVGVLGTRAEPVDPGGPDADVPPLAEPPPAEGSERAAASATMRVRAPVAAEERGRPRASSESVAPLRGTLRSMDTGEPLAGFWIDVEVEGEAVESIQVASDGRFTSSESYPAGSRELSFREGPALSASAATALRMSPEENRPRTVFSRPDDDLDLTVRAGVPLTVTWTGPVAAEALVANLEEATGRSITWAVPVRPGIPSWVRFSRPWDAAQREDAWLALRSLDGEWIGRAAVGEDRPVHVELVRAARLELRLAREDGAPLRPRRGGVLHVDSGRRFVAEPVDDVVATPPDERAPNRLPIRAGELGRFEVDSGPLPPGSYRLHFLADGTRPWTAEVELEPGESRRLDALFAPLPRTLDVRGEVRTRSGNPYRGAEIHLTDSLGEHRLKRRLQWTEGVGEAVARFAFEGVPEATYTLSAFRDLGGVPALFRVSPEPTPIDASVGGVQLILEDEDVNVFHRFEVFDAETGSSIEHTVAVGLPGVVAFAWRPTPRFSGWAAPRGGDYRWCVTAPGYRTAWGRVAGADEDERETLTRVPMERGWAMRLRIVDAATRAPLEGVELVAGERTLGTTDADGRAFLEADTRPGSLEARLGEAVRVLADPDAPGQALGLAPELEPVFALER